MFSTSRVYNWLNSRSLHAHTHKVWFLYLMGFFDSHMALVSLNLIGGDCHFIQFVGVYLVFTLTFVFSGVTNSSQGNNWLRELIVLSQCFNHFFRGLHKLNTGVLIFKSLTNKHILYLIEFPHLAKLYTVLEWISTSMLMILSFMCLFIQTIMLKLLILLIYFIMIVLILFINLDDA